ncbi:sigma-70 family RNA polymerase sigma factor [Undibacterium sp.]|uniref:sigma-70 family RNA polymerase sigma factor n=1 Tax=Undibacterium sp. TaxID=1914977 RepID=UPI0025E94DC4|nr:sigma-70 family RNA polymerase sigma factor [Undibacterium sp.]
MRNRQDSHQQLLTMRPLLLRYALQRLRNSAQAEDAVQEALLAALEQPDRFAGRAAFRTYVTAILKYKIIDILRVSEKETSLAYEDEASESDLIDSLLNSTLSSTHEAYHKPPVARAGNAPDTLLEQKDFFRVLESSLEKLPIKTAKVFMMHAWLECETEEICAELNLSAANLWVLLYRARLRLRSSLNLHGICRLA